MAGAAKVFEVLTEFRFEVQGAVASSSMLQQAVTGISDAADMALNSLQSLGSFFLSGMGLSFSFLGVAAKSVTAFEKTQRSVLGIANVLGANLEHLTGDVDTFIDRTKFAEQTLVKIAKIARENALDETSFAGTFKNIAPVLIPKGLAGQDLGGALDLARSFEKSAPTLGVDTNESQGQLIRAIEGAASMGDTLFRRLASETTAFSDLRKGGKAKDSTAKIFNQLGIEERFKKIADAMRQFSSDADVLAGNASLLSNRLRSLADQFVGLNGILKPIGKVINEALQGPLNQVSNFVDTKGRSIVEDFAKLIKRPLMDLENTYVNLQQLKALPQDVKSAGLASTVFGIISSLSIFKSVLIRFPVVGQIFGGVLGKVGAGLSLLGGKLKMLAIWLINPARLIPMLTFGMAALGFVFKAVLIPMLLFTSAFQIITRAMAKAKIANAKFLADNIDRVLPLMQRFTSAISDIMLPFTMIIDGAANALAPLFGLEISGGALFKIADLFVTLLEGIGKGTLLALAGINGAFMAIFQVIKLFGDSVLSVAMFIGNVLYDLLGVVSGLMSAATGGGFEQLKKAMEMPNVSAMPQSTLTGEGVLNQIKDAFNFGVESTLQDAFTRKEENERTRKVSNNVTHIGKVEVRQDFKENMEPDRIAHSLINTLREVANNPRQAAGRSVSAAAAGG